MAQNWCLGSRITDLKKCFERKKLLNPSINLTSDFWQSLAFKTKDDLDFCALKLVKLFFLSQISDLQTIDALKTLKY